MRMSYRVLRLLQIVGLAISLSRERGQTIGWFGFHPRDKFGIEHGGVAYHVMMCGDQMAGYMRRRA